MANQHGPDPVYPYQQVGGRVMHGMYSEADMDRFRRDDQDEIARLREALHNTLACGLPEVVAAAVIEALQRKEGDE